MYDIDTIKKEFLNLVGWKQNPDPAGMQLDAELLLSNSGIFFQEQHPLITHDNLVASAPLFDRRVHNPYNAATAYVVGNIVIDASQLYISIQDGTGQPTSDISYWKIYNPYSQWVKELTEEGIMRAINDWMEAKILGGSAQTLLSFDNLYKKTYRNTETVENEDDFVFHELHLSRSGAIEARIPRIGITMDAADTFNILLFHSEQDDPIRTMEINYTTPRSKQWFDLKDTTTEVGKELDFVIRGTGTYYLGYNQFSLSAAKAISGLNDHWANTRMVQECRNTTGLSFRSGKVAGPINNMWDLSFNSYGRENYGMDLSISVGCDYTDFLVQNARRFRGLIARSVAVSALNKMAMNPNVRDNRNQKNIDQQYARFILHGDPESPRPGGMMYEYNKALKSLMFDDRSIDPVCLPCKKTGVSFKTIP